MLLLFCVLEMKSHYKAYVALELMILMPHLLRQLVLQTCMITYSYSCAFELFCEAPFREKEVLGSSMPFQTATFSHLLKDLESLQNVT